MRTFSLTSFSSALLPLALLSGCSTTDQVSQTELTFEPTKTVNLTSYYDYALATPAGEPISIQHLAKQLEVFDVILVGEWHTHPGIHLFQAQLFQELAKQESDLALSMEQFSRPSQKVVDQYLAGEIGERILISQGNAWPNYESDYRSLIELAKQNQSPVIAANAPKDTVRCIGREGLAYLESLEIDEREFVASNIDTSNSPYREKFMASMHHGSPEQTAKQYAAQVTWDETMAESIVEFLASKPQAQVMHIAGKFHTEGGLGTAASITKRNPGLSVAIVTPVEAFSEDGTDYQLKVLSPPQRYVNKENRMKAYHSLSKRNDDLICGVVN